MKKLNASILLMLLCLNVFSQKADTTFNFSIKQAVDYAMQNQKDVLNAQFDAEIAHSKVNETIGIGLPQISANFDLKDYYSIPTQFFSNFISPQVYDILYDENLIATKPQQNGDPIPVKFGTRYSATAGVSATQLIFDPSYLIGVKASKTFRELSNKNLNRTKIETAVSVTKAYYALLLLRERKKVVDANTERLLKLLNDTKALFENGFVEKIDLDRVQVANNNIQTESENFERLIAISIETLKFQIGLPPNSNLVVTDSLDAEAVKNIQVSSDKVDPTVRIEYSILKTEEQLQQFNLKRYKSQYYPTLFAYGSINTLAQRTEFTVFESNYKWLPTGLVGATLSLNIFDGAQREARINQQKLGLRKLNNEVSNLESKINLEVSSNRSTLLYAISALNIQEKNLELASSVSKTSKLKYEQGVGSNLEVMDAETSLKESQVNYFNALFNALLAKIELDKAMGKFNY